MKKLALTIAIVLGMGIAASAQGGLFQYGFEDEYGLNRDGGLLTPGLPGEHGLPDNQDAPLAGGALLLIGFGAAYALKKRNEK
ncbi:MAG: hypothetical protein IKU00_10230 [Bacteroidales bacterium]|nr:hypothetical protein [Bacteroidales bacterium]